MPPQQTITPSTPVAGPSPTSVQPSVAADTMPAVATGTVPVAPAPVIDTSAGIPLHGPPETAAEPSPLNGAPIGSAVPAVVPRNPLEAMRSMDFILHWAFRFGFASIFLVNAVVAAVHPEDFSKMLTDNIIAGRLGYGDLMIKIAMVNDLLLGALILLNWQRKIVYAWAGAWLLLVAGLKLMNLVF